jgi:RNA polymerase sigma-70 factor, ECF subfamily
MEIAGAPFGARVLVERVPGASRKSENATTLPCDVDYAATPIRSMLKSKEAPTSEVPSAAASSKSRITRLVEDQLGFVSRVLRNLGVPDSELDDTVQRIFILASKKLDDIQTGSERGFLFRAAKHMAAHVWRSRARNRRLEELDDQLPSSEESPEQLISQKRARELLDHILGRMPNDLRVVFTLYEFEDLTVPEIAELLAIPVGTVASRLRRARAEFNAAAQRVRSRERDEPAKKAVP